MRKPEKCSVGNTLDIFFVTAESLHCAKLAAIAT